MDKHRCLESFILGLALVGILTIFAGCVYVKHDVTVIAIGNSFGLEISPETAVGEQTTKNTNDNDND